MRLSVLLSSLTNSLIKKRPTGPERGSIGGRGISRNGEFRENEEAGLGLRVGVTNARDVGEPICRQNTQCEVVVPTSDCPRRSDEVPFAAVLSVERAREILPKHTPHEPEMTVSPPGAAHLQSDRVLGERRDPVIKGGSYHSLEHGRLVPQSHSTPYVDGVANVQERADGEEEMVGDSGTHLSVEDLSDDGAREHELRLGLEMQDPPGRCNLRIRVVVGVCRSTKDEEKGHDGREHDYLHGQLLSLRQRFSLSDTRGAPR